MTQVVPAGGAAPHGSSRVAVVAEWRAGWSVVLAAGLGIGATCIASFSLGVMLKPITTTYGWSRTQYSAGWSIVTLIMLLASPLVGAAIDRFGARRIAIPALILWGVALASLGLAGPSIISWYAAMAFIGLGMASAGPIAWLPAVASRFDRGRAFALAVALLAVSLVAMITPPLTTFYLGLFGLRLTFGAMAVTALLVAFPFVLLFFRDATDLQRRTGASGVQKAAPAEEPAAQKAGLTLRQAVRSWRFWQLSLSMLVIAGGSGAMNLHFIPMLTDAGAHPMAAATAMSVTGPASMVGRLVSGVLLDRFKAPLVIAVLFSLAAVGYLLLTQVAGSIPLAIACVALIGIAGGAEMDVAAYATSRYFGLRAFGAIYGFMSGLIAFTYGLAPVFVAIVKDQTGSYHWAIIGLAAAVVISTILAATLGKYPTFGVADDQARSPA